MIIQSQLKITVLFFLLVFSLESQAALYHISDRTQFNSLGSIVENYGFEDFGSGFSYPGDPWTEHGVTYVSGNNLIIGTGTFFSPVSNVFGYNSWSPIVAEIDPSTQYNMFAIDLGVMGLDSSITISVQTNVTNYEMAGIVAPVASVGLDFYGFIADAGEYITGFTIESLLGVFSAPVIDNVTLGVGGIPGGGIVKLASPTQIPEPGTLALFSILVLWMLVFLAPQSRTE